MQAIALGEIIIIAYGFVSGDIDEPTVHNIIALVNDGVIVAKCKNFCRI